MNYVHQDTGPVTVDVGGVRTEVVKDEDPRHTKMNGYKRRRESFELLLRQLYDQSPQAANDTFSDTSSTCDGWQQSGRLGGSSTKYTPALLANEDEATLEGIVQSLQTEMIKYSQLLLKYLRRRDRQLSKQKSHYRILTAIVQAHSSKRDVDAALQFTLEPSDTDESYQQWFEGMKAVARLPEGMPNHFRHKLWLTLADKYLTMLGLDWNEVRSRVFSDKMTVDDDQLNIEILKDLHRTGWSGLLDDAKKISLKRVLLAYARYNKTIGYCQGFNVIAALIMEVVDFKEEQALKVMIMLIENVLPAGYFDQTLRALSVDMSVLRDLMLRRMPKLYFHLEHLQQTSDSEYEPPLINVFSMQWFLTMFATCLPMYLVFRLWDSLMLEGSEILLRAALAIFSKISKYILRATSADAFYEIMAIVCHKLQKIDEHQCNVIVQCIYSMAEFPFPGLAELRERHMWNIQPFSSTFRLLKTQVWGILKTDIDDNSDDDTNKTGFICGSARKNPTTTPIQKELSALQKQYKSLMQRQKQAALIIHTVPATKLTGIELDELFHNVHDIGPYCYMNRRRINTFAFNGTIELTPQVVQPKRTNDAAINRNSRSPSEGKRSQSGSAALFRGKGSVASNSSSSGNDLREPTDMSLPDPADPDLTPFFRRCCSCSSLGVNPLESSSKPVSNEALRNCRSSDGLDCLLIFRRCSQQRHPESSKCGSGSVHCSTAEFIGSASSAADVGAATTDPAVCTVASIASSSLSVEQTPPSKIAIENSKAVVDSIVRSASAKSPSAYYPFPVVRHSKIFEHGRKFGLYG